MPMISFFFEHFNYTPKLKLHACEIEITRNEEKKT